MTGLRLIVVENDGEVIAAAWPGKIKTTSQMLAIILLLLNDFLFPDFRLGTILLYVCLFFYRVLGNRLLRSKSVRLCGFLCV